MLTIPKILRQPTAVSISIDNLMESMLMPFAAKRILHLTLLMTLMFAWNHTSIGQQALDSGQAAGIQEAGKNQESKRAVGDQPDKAKGKNKRVKSPTIYWPRGVAANAAIPTPKQFFGFEVGHRHLRHDQVAAYMYELARVSDRITIHQYAETHGGRPLLLLTITSPRNHQRIGEIKNRHRQLARPDSDSSSPDFTGLPVVMNMGYGVHGDEPSATNTSPLVAHYLAAAEGEQIDQVLQNSVILLDPSLNPDGFDRFARWANTFRGKVPNPDSSHIEHNQGWPAGRVNYYWFDLNRDWLPVQHPESQGRMKWYHQWKPNVVLDFHEMGTNSTFFFQPGIPERKNPLTPIENVELTAELGSFHAKALDSKGSLYFTQELFDDFYMGKGSTYPDLHGSIGILFEQGSSRGHVQESANGVIRFSDTIRNQFTASLSSLEGASALREKLLKYKNDFYTRSLQQSQKSKVKTYVFSHPDNATRMQKFADILVRHDIQCYWQMEKANVGDRIIPSGSLIVPAEQPEFRFLRSLVERRKKFQESIFYDVSAWTLPLAFNLKQLSLHEVVPVDGLKKARINGRVDQPKLQIGDDAVSVFVDWRDDAAVKTLQQLLDVGVHVRVAKRPLTAKSGDKEKQYGFGTLAIPLGVQQNKSKRRQIQRVLNRAATKGVQLDVITSGLATEGIDLGSNNFPRIQPRKVAMLVGKGVSSYQAGAVWHQLDNRVGMPVSMIDVERAGRTDFTKYTTVVLASGQYSLKGSLGEKLNEFVSGGGTLIALSNAASSVQSQMLNLSATGNAATPKPDSDEDMPKFSEASKLAALNLVSGAIFATEIDTTHPLMYGFDRKRLPVFRGSTQLLTKANPQVSNPARYLKQPLIAGYASKANEQKIAGTPAIAIHRLGRGQIILMIDDPNFRAFWPATSRVFMNAIYFGPFTGTR